MVAHLIRPFATLEEYQACTALQEEVWGPGFRESVSAAILMIANRLGGLSAGAFRETGEMDGFVFGLTGVQGGDLVHWSDMLAVRPGLRDQGLGSRLKGYQREVLLAREVRTMYWSFDPLQGRNAHINFARLGAVSREYVRDMYGDTDSPLHRGVGTDRLVATWEMASERVEARMTGAEPEPGHGKAESLPGTIPLEREGSLPSPGRPLLGLEAPGLLIAVPAEIEGIMALDLPLAIRWREATRAAMTHYLDRGYEIREFFRGAEVSHYLLEKPYA